MRSPDICAHPHLWRGRGEEGGGGGGHRLRLVCRILRTEQGGPLIARRGAVGESEAGNRRGGRIWVMLGSGSRGSGWCGCGVGVVVGVEAGKSRQEQEPRQPHAHLAELGQLVDVEHLVDLVRGPAAHQAGRHRRVVQPELERGLSDRLAGRDVDAAATAGLAPRKQPDSMTQPRTSHHGTARLCSSIVPGG